MEIAILRHGMPEPIPVDKISAMKFTDWISRYNASGLSKTSHPVSSSLEYIKDCEAIICSSQKRSIESAKVLNSQKIVLSDQLFIEAGLPSANWEFLKLRPKAWAAVFRILWFCGYSNNSESLKEAKERASRAAERLIYLSNEYQKILFVGHGIFNRLLAKELKRQGWSGPRNPGATYWSFGVFTK